MLTTAYYFLLTLMLLITELQLSTSTSQILWHRKKRSYFNYFNKRNDERFNNRGYSLFFLMGIFWKPLWLIPNILKWQDCKIFTKLVPPLIPSRSSLRRCYIKKGVAEFHRKTSVSESLLNKVAEQACNFIKKRL